MACNHVWVRYRVDQLAYEGEPIQKDMDPSWPVSICVNCLSVSAILLDKNGSPVFLINARATIDEDLREPDAQPT